MPSTFVAVCVVLYCIEGDTEAGECNHREEAEGLICQIEHSLLEMILEGS